MFNKFILISFSLYFCTIFMYLCTFKCVQSKSKKNEYRDTEHQQKSMVSAWKFFFTLNYSIVMFMLHIFHTTAVCKCFVLSCRWCIHHWNILLLISFYYFHISSKKPFKRSLIKKRNRSNSKTQKKKLPKTNRTIYNFTFYYWFNFLLFFFNSQFTLFAIQTWCTNGTTSHCSAYTVHTEHRLLFNDKWWFVSIYGKWFGIIKTN